MWIHFCENCRFLVFCFAVWFSSFLPLAVFLCYLMIFHSDFLWLVSLYFLLNKEAVATQWSTKAEDGFIEKWGTFFVYIAPSPSPAQLGSKRNPLAAASFPGGKGNQKDPRSLHYWGPQQSSPPPRTPSWPQMIELSRVLTTVCS